jgi:hypothetical protein
MNRPRLNYTNMDPALQLFILQLSIDCLVDQCAFIRWADANRDALTEGMLESGEPIDTDPRVENCVAIYVLQQFKAQQVLA